MKVKDILKMKKKIKKYKIVQEILCVYFAQHTLKHSLSRMFSCPLFLLEKGREQKYILPFYTMVWFTPITR